MKSEINPNILKKIDEIDEKNVREFLYEILEIEYEKIDETNPKLKDDYVKLIKRYKN